MVNAAVTTYLLKELLAEGKMGSVGQDGAPLSETGDCQKLVGKQVPETENPHRYLASGQ
jgi:hypothetical protein